MKDNKLKKFEDYLVDDPTKILRFGEYRKGSGEYGAFIQELMDFLRTFRKDDEDNLIFKIKDVKFDVEKLHKLNNDENKKRLISFNISFTDKNNNDVDAPVDDGYVAFSELNKKDDRPWEKHIFDE